MEFFKFLNVNTKMVKKAWKYGRLMRFRAKSSPCLYNVYIFIFLQNESFYLQKNVSLQYSQKSCFENVNLNNLY